MSEIETMQGGAFEKIDPEEALQAAEAGELTIIDIREAREWANERIRGALLAPMSEINPGWLPAQEGKRIALCCRSGTRTRNMAEALLAAGAFSRIAHIEGGMIAWRAAGLPVVEGLQG